MPDSPVFARLFSLSGKVALVTGSSSGIGRAIAVGLAEAGAHVVLNGTNLDNLNETARLISAAGGSSDLAPAELSDVHRCRTLAGTAFAVRERLDILVNCAGTNRRKPATEFTEEDFDTILAVNLKSAFFLCQAAHPLMTRHGGGKIINIGSMTSFVGIGNVGVYGMTKSALGQLTRTLAIEWAKDNIQVNCLAPGFIKTPLTAKGLFANPRIVRWILERVPAGRPGAPEDMVGTAVFLASRASDYLTGQVIAVDGGFLAGGSWSHEAPLPVTEE